MLGCLIRSNAPGSVCRLIAGSWELSESIPLKVSLCFLAESQADAETLAAGNKVLNLTCGEKEQSEEMAELPESERGPKEEQKADSLLSEEDAEEKMDGYEEGPEEDSVSNKSLDLNFASKLMDFKLAESDQSAGSSSQTERKHACDICGKTFKFAGTLSRHKKAHIREDRKDERSSEDESKSIQDDAGAPSMQDSGLEQEESPLDLKVVESPVDFEATGKENEESESISEGEGTERKSTEKSSDDKPKTDGAKSTAKADKRKKVCTVCNKRFWSLQDLTRHMRSHTGKRRLEGRADHEVSHQTEVSALEVHNCCWHLRLETLVLVLKVSSLPQSPMLHTKPMEGAGIATTVLFSAPKLFFPMIACRVQRRRQVWRSLGSFQLSSYHVCVALPLPNILTSSGETSE